jgi:hypothetical protein
MNQKFKQREGVLAAKYHSGTVGRNFSFCSAWLFVSLCGLVHTIGFKFDITQPLVMCIVFIVLSDMTLQHGPHELNLLFIITFARGREGGQYSISAHNGAEFIRGY